MSKKYFYLFFNPTILTPIFLYNGCGDDMRVKVIDEGHEKDLENSVNEFLSEFTGEVIDIKYQVALSVFSEEQVYCFSAMIIYKK